VFVGFPTPHCIVRVPTPLCFLFLFSLRFFRPLRPQRPLRLTPLLFFLLLRKATAGTKFDVFHVQRRHFAPVGLVDADGDFSAEFGEA